jgi:lipopolysaccharide/colanic/teichoic acid biosynthesis glycosyltransferase
MKRAMDVVVAGLVMALTSPIMALIAAAIVVTMGRPVLFRQVRPGLASQPFVLYKFRTMRVDPELEAVSLGDETRITPLGSFLRRTSLDELPELWNVLKGDMSLVGPRPLLVEYLSLYTPEQARRHDLKPGMTGLTQISGRNELTWDKRLVLDVWYVDHHSFWLDLKILAMTLPAVLGRKGISAPGYVTTPKFRGEP